ncbi:MAG: Gfo/Idh/MocA family oxidoreductase [Planctomycetes bacterium]|nr:Gfo/Idh/MocA family oxidoreductase [Planctomycetota bacterium]
MKDETDTRRLTRRAFLRRTALGAVAAPWVIPASARDADGAVAPSERITLGLIGIGAMGRGHLGWCVGNRAVQLLAVCDVDRVRCDEGKRRVEAAYAAERASGAFRGCTAYNDYRELLARPDIDAVVIATPDHWHSLQAIDAAKSGKDIYCEKPVSLTIHEGRRMAETVRRYARVFQTGTQYRSNPTIRRVCDFVRAGGLGKVKAAFTLWSKLGVLGTERFKPYADAMKLDTFAGSYVPASFPLPAEPVPDGLDWDLWVGPAPWRPYNRLYHENPSPGVVPWAFCEDFGAASVTWHHSHSADVVQYALGMETSGPVEILHPLSGQFPTLTCRYANGTLLHLVDHWGMVKTVYKAVPAAARLEGSFGGVLVGERGWVTTMHVGGPIEGGPESLFEEMRLRTREVTGGNNHHANWLECIRTRGRPSTDEEIGHRSASLGHLAIICYKLRRSLKWDPVKEEFLGDPEANRLRSRALREPWRL